jgi:transposase InsO family protein
VPWKETCQVQERLKLIMEIEKGEKPIALLCREYEISRQTAYKWLARHRQDPCALSLEDRSRRPLYHPGELDAERVDLIARARRTWPHWGPRKLRIKLADLWPEGDLPSASTIGRVLKRLGLIHTRKRRRRTPPYTRPFAKCTAPNQLWCIDFKGNFRTGDGSMCYPLTITDAFSRFLVRCQIVGQPDTVVSRCVWNLKRPLLPADSIPV